MTYQLRNASGFEIRSVLLFAAISLGAASAMAQSSAPQPTFGGGPATGVQAAPAPSSGASDVQAAFDRADVNKDGKLSKKEAEALPAVSSAFAQIDADKNGSLSREEFEKAVQAR